MDETQKTMNQAIETMMAAQSYAVVGASAKPEKYGHLVYRDLKRFGKTVFPINKTTDRVDGDIAYPSVSALPVLPEVVVAVVPPAVTEKLVSELTALGIRNLWLQEGAESDAAIAKAVASGITVVHGGPCIMVRLRTHFPHR